ncbi:siderophore-interacting protein [Prauserella cavernicola]|uniref:Siderophore-interacting protein n=1 Tax=Prauserella cavernicola TaxID=2800127 RepID=A0A934V4L2_9PSEU|nr:siderophore-interacting protein [Prauserella cavernicola]MBK1783703.1 siderophore-interacting protein [Prauserella cavernicola]
MSVPVSAVKDEVRPYRVARAHVVRVADVTPGMRRVTVGGAELASVTSAGLDQRIKVVLPQPGQHEPVVSTGPAWYGEHQRLPDDVRPVLRTYTVRAFRPGLAELDIDFVLHGDTGPASRWAARASAGDRLAIVAPDARHDPITGYEFRPPEGATWSLIAGDETALPAIAGIVEGLAPGHRAVVLVEIGTPGERQTLRAGPGVDVSWIVREDGPRRLLDAVRDTALPDGPGHAWIAGESGAITRVRRHLVSDRGFERGSVYFSGYWKRGEPS